MYLYRCAGNNFTHLPSSDCSDTHMQTCSEACKGIRIQLFLPGGAVDWAPLGFCPSGSQHSTVSDNFEFCEVDTCFEGVSSVKADTQL